MEQEYLKIDGSLEEIKKIIFPAIVDSRANSDVLFSIIKKYPNLLSEDETFEEICQVAGPGYGYVGFLTLNAKYHINVKYTTLAFLCLLFDIQFSEGLASFLYNFFGFNYSVVKLEDFEKCIAFKIHSEKKISAEALTDLVQCQYKYYREKCGMCSEDGECRRWDSSNIQKVLDILLRKKVINYNQGYYESVF